ncbi:MAG: hypothetical protein ACK56I_37045, partial [bacterium]
PALRLAAALGRVVDQQPQQRGAHPAQVRCLSGNLLPKNAGLTRPHGLHEESFRHRGGIGPRLRHKLCHRPHDRPPLAPRAE